MLMGCLIINSGMMAATSSTEVPPAVKAIKGPPCYCKYYNFIAIIYNYYLIIAINISYVLAIIIIINYLK